MLSLGVFGTLALGVLPAFAGPISGRSLEKRTDDDSFSLYVYGPNVGGYQVVYKSGSAYAVSPDVDISEHGFTNITFTWASSDSQQLLITPIDNTTALASEPLYFGFSNSTSSSSNSTTSTTRKRFAGGRKASGTVANEARAESTSTAGPGVGFASNSSSYETDGWVFYGNTLIYLSSDENSTATSRFYIPSSSSSSIFEMGWSSDDDDTSTQIPVALRRVKASNT